MWAVTKCQSDTHKDSKVAEEGEKGEKKKLRRKGEGGLERREEEKTGKGCEEERGKGSGRRGRDLSLNGHFGNTANPRISLVCRS